ncbi:MAG: Rne/Rng family ribonuclease [Rickettsiales bacterium]|jgi:ribonuclease E|nr:Rne/Rng family ribonuclease [Rickettsiales bacterium]
MPKQVYVDAVHPEEVRVAVVDNNKVADFDVETTTKPQIKGNIYLAKVVRVEPSLQAAFVEYGAGKNGFLPFSEIHPDYYDVQAQDKKAMMESAHANMVDDDDDQDEENSEFVEYDDNSAGEDNKEILKRMREYKIQDVIKPKQIMLIQGVKEERGQKGASMTTYLSLAGRFAVFMPNSRKRNLYGISKKIGGKEERARLRDILHGLKIPRGMTVVLRTAAAGASKDDIAKDYEYLTSLWNEIRQQTLKSVAPAIIHTEDSLLRRVVRDFISDERDVLTIQGDEAFEQAQEYFKMMHGTAPKNQIVKYEDKVPLFVKVNIEQRLEGLHKPEVNLPSGGSIVLNQTEAMVTIDVNSSHAIKEKNIEETALNTNLEAAEEIAIQLRLRDMAGIVAIDFIDMEDEKNRRKVEARVRELMKRDRARTQVAKINNFGVLMLSRQRLRSSFIESSYVQCPHCTGTGVVPSIQTASVIIFRHLQEKMMNKAMKKIAISVPSDVAIYLLNQKREDLSKLESEYDVDVVVLADDSLSSINQYQIMSVPLDYNDDDALRANEPAGNTPKKKSPEQQAAKKTVIDTPVHRSGRRRRGRNKNFQQQQKKQSFWKKLVG